MRSMRTVAPMVSTLPEPKSFLGFAVATLLSAVPAAAQQPMGEISWSNPPEEPIPGLEHRSFESSALGERVGYNVLLPPEYEGGGDRYPVLYWLHGAGGHESSLAALEIAPRIRRMMEAGQAPQMVVVFPNGGPWTMYVDAADGSLPVETMIVHELLSEVEAEYRVRTDRRGRALEGMSMGGFGALRLGLEYHDLFASVVAYAPALLDLVEQTDGTMALEHPGSTYPPALRSIWDAIYHRMFGGSPAAWHQRSPWDLARRNAERVREDLAIRIVIGSEDGRDMGSSEGLVPATRLFHGLLLDLGIDHEFEIVEGVGHDPRPLYDQVGLQGLRFHASRGGW